MNDFYKRLAYSPVNLAKELKKENDELKAENHEAKKILKEGGKARELLYDVLEFHNKSPEKITNELVDRIRKFLKGDDHD